MKIKSAMEYAEHADFNQETIACMRKWLGKYCVFKLSYEVIDDEEPEDNGPRFTIEYIGGRLDEIYETEGEVYTGNDHDSLSDDIIELIDLENIDFQIYQATTDSEVIPHIYRALMPEFIPDYDQMKDLDTYQHQIDRTLHHLQTNKRS